MLAASILTLSLLACSPTGDDVKPEEIQASFERDLAAKDDSAIEELFRAHPFAVIGLIDGYLESWLAAQENEAKDVDVPALMDKAQAGARIADKTFGVDAYSRYANAWKGWTAEQRLQFRAGQQAYGAGRAGMKEKDLAAARAGFEESLKLAEPLGDLWGIAQAEASLGDVAVGDGRMDDAIKRHERAVEIFGSLNHTGMLRSLRALGQIHEQKGDLKAARKALERMVKVAKDAHREESAEPVKKDLARICRALGDEDAAKRYEG